MKCDPDVSYKHVYQHSEWEWWWNDWDWVLRLSLNPQVCHKIAISVEYCWDGVLIVTARCVLMMTESDNLVRVNVINSNDKTDLIIFCCQFRACPAWTPWRMWWRCRRCACRACGTTRAHCCSSLTSTTTCSDTSLPRGWVYNLCIILTLCLSLLLNFGMSLLYWWISPCTLLIGTLTSQVTSTSWFDVAQYIDGLSPLWLSMHG